MLFLVATTSLPARTTTAGTPHARANKYDVLYCFTYILAPLCFTQNGFEFESCLWMSPLKWEMPLPSKMFMA